ncbi:MAG TPA: glutamine-hydrolyzing carbamoyl-phosphate synthase small subunit [Fermentimonas caenicola]|jgi:carbamoyl-phosphate synthase small subunit|nr:glutamine-hydrolyzing carbamoyl-phosphate synthase small subunit [Fermentimonas sp.]MBP7103514.1 glutamine-hydrolyzing carbamoyl-phosphate synthase small subunit [Fermentimonas sp.]MDI9625204.1 glutamine-hydrolyzing carbamoyl-phosphate synthase small subunit [Bacteroidota bacterium]HHU40913.1 glutamine-hydrolyzing carbamoyl-phosphate synthase small subunit [Fermentimonas caenicola]
MHKLTPVRLILENGMVFQGKSFGAEKPTSGEVVFSTSMVGYPESLTDPSYKGQILSLTYPIIGNYGVPAKGETDGISDFFESEHIHASGLIIQDYTSEYSHWNGIESLGEWLKNENIPGICDVDTRKLTKILREEGSLLGKIVFDESHVSEKTKDASKAEVNISKDGFYNPDFTNLVAEVSCKEVIEYGDGVKKVVLVDCGVKLNILRELIKQGVKVIRVPWDYDFNTIDFDGVVISNGPGNPDHCIATVENIRKAMNSDKPIFGICMGNQLLSKAAGAKIYKLKYGHRSHNQPVRRVGSNQCFITSQNHGYAVDDKGLGKEWEPWYVNLNDGTNEGIRHKSKPFYSVQFHPEANGGPNDTRYFFDEFVKLL